MKPRENGFLKPDRMPADVFDYIKELHQLLWRVARIQSPGASGDIADLIEPAVQRLEASHGYVPDGWILVPVEPTEAMLDALENTGGATGAYAAMLKAAPKGPGA